MTATIAELEAREANFSRQFNENGQVASESFMRDWEVTATALCKAYAERDAKRTLMAYRHNGFSVQVQGHEKSIDALKELLIPHTMVKGIVIYGGDPLEKLEAMNYTQLKEARK